MQQSSSLLDGALYQFEQIRARIAEMVESVPRERLYEIPNGFINNMAWHAAHTVVTQQLLVYGLSGLELEVSDEVVARYRKGTPGENATPESFDEAMAWLMIAPVDIRQKIAAGAFESFTRYETSAGITLNSTEEAILFNNIHEGIHLGYMMGIRKGLQIV